MNWKKIIAGFGISLIGVYFIFGDTQILTDYENYVFQKKLKAIVRSGAKEFKLSDIVDFEWDKACFYVHYDYRTGERDRGSGSWVIDFRYSGKEIRDFRIKYSILDLKPYTELTSFFCYGRDKVLTIENNFINLDKNRLMEHVKSIGTTNRTIN
jgi:hypothetical protein